MFKNDIFIIVFYCLVFHANSFCQETKRPLFNNYLKNPKWLCVVPASVKTYCLERFENNDGSTQDTPVIDITQENIDVRHTFVGSLVPYATCWHTILKIQNITDTIDTISPGKIDKVCFYGSLKIREFSKNYPDNEPNDPRSFEEWKLAAVKTELGIWKDPNF